MNYVLIILLGLALVTALPAVQVERTLPIAWQYSIASLRGPGCPDFGKDPTKQRTTRLTFGKNTMDGTEIYYWFVAYPHLRVNLDGENHSWCETELSYKEFKDLDKEIKGGDYRLRLHKNGTSVIATYDLEEGVKATFKFTYNTGYDEITDTINWHGPISSGQYQKEDNSPSSLQTYRLPECGEGTIKFRTDLTISGKKGKKGFVESEYAKDSEGKDQYYGIQQGFSYNWERCKQ